MMNSFEETAEWRDAGILLNTVVKEHFDRGSIGISDYMANIFPIWNRYNSGERTEDLLTTIQSLKDDKS